MAVPPKYRHMGDFSDYYNGVLKAPIPTIFIGGNHEASNHLQELYYGGWVCPNIYYLGHSGVVKFGGLRIAGISGIFGGRHFNFGYYEKPPFTPDMVRSAYHYREYEFRKLSKIKEPIDIFISHDWPSGIYNYGDLNNLLRRKPYFREEVSKNELGSRPLEGLMKHLKPRHWFSAHLHVGFEATYSHNDGQYTHFLALDKCLPNRDYLRTVDVASSKCSDYKLEYDEEWLGILKEAEPFMSRRHGSWFIPANFDSIKPEYSTEIGKELEKGKYIECPRDFSDSKGFPTIRQTENFKSRFLCERSSTSENPDEIQLDL